MNALLYILCSTPFVSIAIIMTIQAASELRSAK